jgi:hypothetical protein
LPSRNAGNAGWPARWAGPYKTLSARTVARCFGRQTVNRAAKQKKEKQMDDEKRLLASDDRSAARQRLADRLGFLLAKRWLRLHGNRCADPSETGQSVFGEDGAGKSKMARGRRGATDTAGTSIDSGDFRV